MRVKQIVICDKEQSYVERLVRCLQGKKERTLQYIGITSCEDFPQVIDEGSLYLLGESFWEKEYIKEVEGRVMLLGNGYVPKELMGYPMIEKYQDSQGILRNIFQSQLWNRLVQEEGGYYQTTLKVTGIYSPNHHPDLVYYSLHYAKGLEGKVVLIPLLENGFYHFQDAYEVQSDLLDVIYLLEEQEEEFDIRGFIYRAYEMDLILPPYVSGGTSQLTKQQIEALLEVIQSRTDYDQVVLCFDCMTKDFLDLWKSFHSRLLLGEGSEQSQLAKRQFVENAKLYYGNDWQEMVKQVDLPVSNIYHPQQISLQAK